MIFNFKWHEGCISILTEHPPIPYTKGFRHETHDNSTGCLRRIKFTDRPGIGRRTAAFGQDGTSESFVPRRLPWRTPRWLVWVSSLLSACVGTSAGSEILPVLSSGLPFVLLPSSTQQFLLQHAGIFVWNWILTHEGITSV